MLFYHYLNSMLFHLVIHLLDNYMLFYYGDGCHGSDSKFSLFNSSRIDAINITEVRDKAEGE